jgi:hypothetical protein
MALLRSKRIQQLDSGMLHIGHVTSHQGEVIHLGGGGQKTVDGGAGARSVQATPRVGHRLVHGEDTLREGLAERIEPALQGNGLLDRAGAPIQRLCGSRRAPAHRSASATRAHQRATWASQRLPLRTSAMMLVSMR